MQAVCPAARPRALSEPREGEARMAPKPQAQARAQQKAVLPPARAMGRPALSELRAAGAGGALVLATAVFFGPARFLLWTVTGNGGYLALRGSAMATVWRGLVMSGSFVGLNVAYEFFDAESEIAEESEELDFSML